MSITIALTKGSRALAPSLGILSSIGIESIDDISSSRKLVFDTNRDDVKLMILRGMDVATYVEHGIADLGIAGKDVLLEYDGTG